MTQDRRLIARFDSAAGLLAALRQLNAAGFDTLDALTPCPIEPVEAFTRPRRRPLGTVILAFGLSGFLIAMALEEFGAADSYPIDIGGRPFSSWPAWVPIAWETAVLWAVAAGVLAIICFSRLPDIAHPSFLWPGVDRSMDDQFLLCVAVGDDAEQAKAGALLASCHAAAISAVPV